MVSDNLPSVITPVCHGKGGDRVESLHTIGLRSVEFVALTRIASEKVVLRWVAAIEGLTMMRFRDGFLSPGGQRHRVSGNLLLPPAASHWTWATFQQLEHAGMIARDQANDLGRLDHGFGFA